MTITEFLLARIEEDERSAEHGSPHNASTTYANDNYGALLVQPERVLAECAAKRAIIEDTQTYVSEYENEEYRTNDTQTAGRVAGRARSWRDDTLRTLATIYADHPDYNPAWRVK